VLGLKPALGRLLVRSDDVAGAAPVGVLTHEYWTRALGRDASIIGRTVTVNGAPVTVVGVAPAAFRGMHLGVVPAIWMPVHAWPAITPSSQRSARIEERGWGWLRIVGRRPADASLEKIHALIATALSTLSEVTRAVVQERSRPRGVQAAALPPDAREGVVRFVAVLAGVVILVLLTACANIAGLMLSRATFREREIGVRSALGAGRFRLVRQLLTEAFVLSLAGAVAGLGVFALARALLGRTTLPGGVSGDTISLALNGQLLAVAVAIALITGLIFGLLPAVQGTRPDTIAALKNASTRRGTWQHYLRGGLVTAQVAVALVLLVGTGLFSRALNQALAIDLGYRTEPLAMLSVDPGLAQLEVAPTRAYIAAVTERVRTMPGITAVTWQRTTPLDNDFDREQAQIEGYTPARDERIRVEMNTVGPRYHEVVGIPLISGRGFNEQDVAGATPVVVVNETLARRYFAGRDPIGQHITMRRNRWLIVGVARDIVYHEVNEPGRPYAYFPMLQTGGLTPNLVFRAERDPGALLPSVVAAVRTVNPAVPVGNATTMSAYVRLVFAPQVAGAWLLGVFSLLALVVAAVGIYGIVAYAVSQRTREISIRLALGARGSSVLKLIVGSNLAFVALGIPIGIALATLLARGLSRFLFGVSTSDALTLATTSALMLLIGVTAAYIPARRATRIDQNLVLRS
jgi:predicted permease